MIDISPGGVVLAAIFSGVSKLCRRIRLAGSRPRLVVPTTIQEAYGKEKADQAICNLREAVRINDDCTMEQVSFFVEGEHRSELSKSLRPGDYVDFRIQGNEIKLYVDGKYIASAPVPDKSRLRSRKLTYGPEAVFVSRDWSYLYSDVDFISVAFFYRMPGVAPTKVDVE